MATKKKAATKKEAASDEMIEATDISVPEDDVFILPRSLEISGIEKIYQNMLEKLKNTYSKFTIDAGEVALVDAAGIQLLVHFIRTLKAGGCDVCWENYSIQVYQVAAELSLDDELGE